MANAIIAFARLVAALYALLNIICIDAVTDVRNAASVRPGLIVITLLTL